MRIAVHVGGERGSEVAAEAQRHGHIVTRVSGHPELVAAFAERLVDVAIVAGDAALSVDLLAPADATGVRMVVLASTVAQRRRLTRLGLHEVVDARASWSVIEAALGRAPGNSAEPRSFSAVTIAVWGPHGAPGRTSVAISLAAELAMLDRTVVLIDADTHAASVAPALGLADGAPGFAVACRLARSGELTSAEVTRVSELAGAGDAEFRVLTGIPHSSRWTEVHPENVEAVLAECRGEADVVVVDVGASLERNEGGAARDAAAIAVLAAADVVVAVAAADPLGLARFVRIVPHVRDLIGGSLITVVNRVRASALGARPREQAASALARFAGIHGAVMIPDDRPAFDVAMLEAAPLATVAPRSAARLALRDLALSLLPPRADHAPRRRDRRRVLTPGRR
ncbi:regulator [Antiquaquibacter oligotrophicus]|nr:regulator [Antiquaquibacter oligotrophicus]UDF12675.1 regulator [Antiquaquibacter oligotrophicus]